MTAKKPAAPKPKKPSKTLETAEPAAAKPSRQDTVKVWFQNAGRFIAKTSLPEIFLVATVCLSRYLQNSDFSYPSEVVLDIVLLGILGSFAFYAYRFILRNLLGAHVAGLLLTYSLYAFTYAFSRLRHIGEKLIPDSTSTFVHALLMVLFLGLVFGVVGYGIQKLAAIKQLKNVPLLKFLVFVLCFIFAVQIGKVGLRMWEIRKDLSYRQPTSSLQKPATTAATKPNVYYLLFDRYANADTLKTIYGYDNSAFLGSLQDQGFVLRDAAYSNYPFTMMSVSSTLSAGYHTNIAKEFKNDAAGFQTAFPYRQILDNSPVTQAFQANGYQYNQVSSWWDFTRMNPSADTKPSESFRLRLLGKNFWLTDLQRDIVNKSVLSPLLLHGLTIGNHVVVQYQLDRNPAQNFYAEIDALKAIAANSSKQTKPQFTFAHVLSPHDPYVFDAQGKTPTYDGNRTDDGADETQKYVNQLTFVNTKFTDLIASIRKDDPDAVIIVQADEGPYPKQFRGNLTSNHYYNPIDLPIDQMRQKFGILAAYYLPGVDNKTANAAMDSSVNTFRFVLNHYLGYSLPTLPDCQFTVGDKYNLYTYDLVSGRLKNTAEPAACNQYK